MKCTTDTPFNIINFESLLRDHPNQPFARSAMQGLRGEFWPFGEGDRKNEQNNLSGNYGSLSEDLDAIRSLSGKELQVDRWPPVLPIAALLLGMAFPPMFIAW